MHDVIIAGGGPAAIAVASTLRDGGLDTVIYEKGTMTDALTRFPYYMKWFSTAENLELGGFPLIIRDEKPTREEYLTYLRRFVQEKKLPYISSHEIMSVQPLDTSDPTHSAGLRVSGKNSWGEPFVVESRFVVLATGAFGQPRMLGIPGEDLPKVSHYFTEVHPYVGKEVAIIGGRSSAVENALLLYRAGAQVTLIHRGPAIVGLKYWLQPDIENRIKKGDIRAFFDSRVIEIRRYHIIIRTGDNRELTLENDYVLAMTGYQPDVGLLQSIGIEVDPETTRPKHDPATLESNVAGVYIAGVITAGNVSNEVFIENSRHHGGLILESIREKLKR